MRCRQLEKCNFCLLPRQSNLSIAVPQAASKIQELCDEEHAKQSLCGLLLTFLVNEMDKMEDQAILTVLNVFIGDLDRSTNEQMLHST